MSLEPPKLELRKIRVHIEMKPIDIIDKYVKKPSKADVLDALANSIHFGTQDEKFTVVITPEE